MTQLNQLYFLKDYFNHMLNYKKASATAGALNVRIIYKMNKGVRINVIIQEQKYDIHGIFEREFFSP